MRPGSDVGAKSRSRPRSGRGRRRVVAGAFVTAALLVVWFFVGFDPEFYATPAATGLDPVCVAAPQSAYSFRVVRGGSWYHGANRCRVTDRYYNPPSSGSLTIGLRPVFIPQW